MARVIRRGVQKAVAHGSSGPLVVLYYIHLELKIPPATRKDSMLRATSHYEIALFQSVPFCRVYFFLDKVYCLLLNLVTLSCSAP